jgi:hypothetical protein
MMTSFEIHCRNQFWSKMCPKKTKKGGKAAFFALFGPFWPAGLFKYFGPQTWFWGRVGSLRGRPEIVKNFTRGPQTDLPAEPG